MNSRVFIHANLNTLPYIDLIAVGLAFFHDTGKYPDFLGHCGRFERNTKATESQLSKIHIALYDSDWTLKTWQSNKGYNRTSDNFVVYTQHFFFDTCFQILGIVSPQAHSRIDSLLPKYIELAEQFHRLGLSELEQKICYTTDNIEILKQIKITD